MDFFFFTVLHNLQDLTFWTGDWTWAHNNESAESTTGPPRNSLFYFSICILNYLYFKPKFLERFTEVNGLIGLTEVRWWLPHFSFCKRKGMARGKLPSVHTATEQVQWGQASKKGAWEQGENKRHLEDQNRSLPVWSWVI